MRASLLLVIAATTVVASGCSVRQKGDAGQTEARLRDPSLASPVGVRTLTRDDKRYMRYMP